MPNFRNTCGSLSLLALFLLPAADIQARDATPALESVLLMRVDATITLDPQGKLVDFVIKTPVIPSIHDSLERSVRQWQFKPTVIDGAPRQVNSDMRVVLSASKVGGNYRIAVDDVLFLKTENSLAATKPLAPPPLGIREAPPPSYPENSWPLTGRVLLAICVGADGHTERVEAVQSMLSNVKGRNSVLLKVIDGFERAAVGASQRWTFEIAPERAGMSEWERTGYVTVVFPGDKDPNYDRIGVWNTVVRSPLHAISWLPATDSRYGGLGVADLANGELFLADSAIQVDVPEAAATLN